MVREQAERQWIEMGRNDVLRGMGLGVIVASAIISLTGCGKQEDSSTTTTAASTVKSASYASSLSGKVDDSQLFKLLPGGVSAQAATTVTDFKMCIGEFKIEAESGSAITNGGSDLMKTKIGLVDLSDPTQEITWGTADIPEGVSIKRIKVQVKKDKDRCAGAEYSVSFNGQTISKDLEFKFKFAALKQFVQGSSVRFNLGQIVSQYVAAAAAGKFSDEGIGNYIENLESDAEDLDDDDASPSPSPSASVL